MNGRQVEVPSLDAQLDVSGSTLRSSHPTIANRIARTIMPPTIGQIDPLRLSMRINTNRFSHRDWYKKAEGVTTTRAARSAGN